MPRNALFLGAIILAAANLVCMAAEPGFGTQVDALAAAAASGPGPCAFAESVPVLPASFDPATATGTPPATGPQAPPKIKSDLRAAFDIGPPFFRRQLCGLDGIFVTSGPASWGYRNIDTRQRFIALSLELWSGDPPSAIPLNVYENRVMAGLLRWPAGDPAPPEYLPATPSDGLMTVLAVLAHEFGHVLWADTFIEPPGSEPQYDRFCPGVFPAKAWIDVPAHKRWRHFGEVAGMPGAIPDSPGDDPNDPPAAGDPSYQDIRIERLLAALRGSRLRHAHKILARLHARNRPWPSLFGAFSPNEDFVETFTLFTLTHATPPLTSLPLQIPIGRRRISIRNIPATIAERPLLSALLQCFDNRFGGASP
ncbi:MAG: hypothetical protein JO305_01035 [Alphaproteobacteria bacterium]|nr:hypothetical protein [Alphaproteobacteria bacterium]